MKLSLFLLPRAEADIDAHCAFLAQTSVEKALLFDEAVFDSFERLCEMPLIGSERKFYNRKLGEFVCGLSKDLKNISFSTGFLTITLRLSGFCIPLRILIRLWRTKT